MIELLIKEKHYIAAVKPRGILSEPSEKQKGEADMPSLLVEQLGSPVFPVHRLDKETSGIMLFASDKTGARALSELIASGGLHKTYLAAVEGTLSEPSGEWRDLLFFDRRKDKSFIADRLRAGVKEALLSYETADAWRLSEADVTAVRIALQTGRTHQIRVQFASRRHPLLGDRRYGSRFSGALALCAAKIEFTDPFNDKTVCCALKDADVINGFKNAAYRETSNERKRSV